MTVQINGRPQVTIAARTDAVVIPTGPPGRRGISGAEGSGSYVHVQSLASTVWTINHELSFRPSVTVVDGTGVVIIPDIEYVTDSQIVITHATARTGYAYLS